jgi:hypothetical protein
MQSENLTEAMYALAKHSKGAPLTDPEKQEINQLFENQPIESAFGRAVMAVAGALNTTRPIILEMAEATDKKLIEDLESAAAKWEKEYR